MKIKPASKNGGVIMELGAAELQIPAPAAPLLPPHPDFRLKRILVPVDFSPCSQKALQYALALVGEFGGELVLIHVVEPYYFTGDMAVDLMQLQKATEQAAKRQMEALRRTIKPASRGVVRTGKPANEIVKEAKTAGADLIVISTHGRSGLMHAIMGSVAERVIRHASCPVLVVREREREFVNTPRTAKKAGRRAAPVKPAKTGKAV